MFRIVLFLLLLLLSDGLRAQGTLHIVTAPRNYLPGFPRFHIQLNGRDYVLKAGDCMEMKIRTDSIHVRVEDRRWIKKETLEVHIPATETDVYIWVRVTWKGNYRNPQYGAEVVCKTCFEELKKQCRRTIYE